MEKRKYHAFISYCHRDKPRAKRLYRRLQRYRVPPRLIRDQMRERQITLPGRLTPIFIDDEEMMGTSVRQGMMRGLTQSRFLIVICSPNSAQSPYVDYEVEFFLRDGRGDRIIPYIIEGRPCSNDPETECYPPSIRGKDRLGADEQQLKEDALLRVIATMLDVDMGVLSQKEKRRRIRQIVTLGAMVILILLALMFYNQQMNRRIADQHQLMLASEAKRLTTCAVDEDIDMDLSILLARQACDYLPEAQVETSDSLTAFRSALVQKEIAETRDFLFPVHTLTFDTTDIEIGRSYASGTMLACQAGECTCLYNLASGECVFKYDSRQVFFSPDASWCIVTQFEGDKCTATGIDVPSGKVLFKTAPRDLSGMWSNLLDVVVFEDDSTIAYIVSGEEDGHKKAPVDSVTRDGIVTRYGIGAVPAKVHSIYDAIPPGKTWYEMALTSACYKEPYALSQETDLLRDDLAVQGYVVESAQIFPAQDLRLYQCRMHQDGNGETLLYDQQGQLCCVIPGRACYDTSNGCIYARNNETIRIYRTLPANRNFSGSGTSPLISGISRDGSRVFFLSQAGDAAERFKASHIISQQVRVCSLDDGRELFDGALHVSQMQTILCQIDADMNGLLYLDPRGEFHLHDIAAGYDRCAWPAEDIDAVNALCFNEDERFIVVALVSEGGTYEQQDRYQIELRDFDTGKLLTTCDITQELDVRYPGMEITTVRLLNRKLLVGTTTKSYLFDVSGNEVDVSSCISSDSMQGNCADPLSAQLTEDGLLIFTSVDVNDSSKQCLRGIYDIERGMPVPGFSNAAFFAYDAGAGTLVCQAYSSDDTLMPGIRIYQRQSDGSFRDMCEILSARPDMALRGGQNALDDGYVMLENSTCCEIYRLEDGELMLWLNNTGFAMRNGMLYDMKLDQSLGTIYDYQLDYAHARALSEHMLKTDAGIRDFTNAELERYYIVSME